MKTEDVIKWAFNKGYRVNEEGQLLSFTGRLLKTRTNKMGYKETNVRICGKLYHLYVHRLCAYQKYGNKLFLAECVRHLDGNPQNNKKENIEIGTLSDNSHDIPQEKRIRCAINASYSTKNYRNVEILKKVQEFYRRTKSYKNTMEAFSISSKGTLHYMLNKRNNIAVAV